jgi:hypothetical protein
MNRNMTGRKDMVVFGCHWKLGLALASLAIVPGAIRAADNPIPVQIHGTGWLQAGRIGHVTDTIGPNYTGNWFQSVAAMVSATAEISETWEGSLGIGVRQIQKGLSGLNVSQGSPSSDRRLQIGVEPYIAQARFSYVMGGDRLTTPFQVNFGYFPFTYMPNTRDLGLYLIRGTVYPGFLFSGFEADETIGLANLLGINLHSNTGPFVHDLLLTSETRIRPLFDYSLTYISKFKPSSTFEIGAGVNFYRLLPIKPSLTTPRSPTAFAEKDIDFQSKYDHSHFYVDTTGGKSDTTRFTLKGIKVGAFMSWDLKGLIGQGAMGPEDLKIYSEAAIIGVKNYKGIYDDRSQRIPLMVGFNIPVFNLLDHLSIEFEYYKAPYKNDYLKLENEYSPIPVGNVSIGRSVKTDSTTGKTYVEYSGQRYPDEDPYNVLNMHKDDFKWALHASKTVKNHIRISGQVANDHFRTGGTALTDAYNEAFTTMKDWYWMTKLSYFF